MNRDTDIESGTSLGSGISEQARSYFVPINPNQIHSISPRTPIDIIPVPDISKELIEETEVEAVAPRFIKKQDSQKSASIGSSTVLEGVKFCRLKIFLRK